MDFRGLDIRKIAFKTLFCLITIMCVGLLVWALRYSYRHLDLHLIVWIPIYLAIAVYFFFAARFVSAKSGFNRFVSHVAALQLLPVLASILLFALAPNKKETTSCEPMSYEIIPCKPLTGSVKVYERRFNDMQDKQKRAALANGLAPFKSQADIEACYKKLRREKKLVKIESNSKYIVRSLTYSSPYVVPKVEKLLDDIADIFRNKTQTKAKFIVTSVLRTEEDVKKLKRVNGNASTNSCHCNATTIDISYVRFDDDPIRPRNNYELRLALAQALHELREAGHCYVKIERKQYCYHITVR